MKQALVNVTLIVGSEFAGDLLSLALSSHVWISDKAVDIKEVRRIWENRTYKKGKGSLTTFIACESPEDSVADMLLTIDLHHGEYSQEPPWHIITVIGAQPTHEIREILSSLGVDSVEETADGFCGQR
jgi:hypothetical protein